MIPARISSIRFSSAASSTISRPLKSATTSAVRSSAVGPRPPLVTISASPSSAMNRSAASRSSGRSPTIWIVSASTPSSSSRSDSHGPLRSEMIPVRTSVPVIRIPARGAPVRGLAPRRRSRARRRLRRRDVRDGRRGDQQPDRRRRRRHGHRLAVDLHLNRSVAQRQQQLGAVSVGIVSPTANVRSLISFAPEPLTRHT